MLYSLKRSDIILSSAGSLLISLFISYYILFFFQQSTLESLINTIYIYTNLDYS